MIIRHILQMIITVISVIFSVSYKKKSFTRFSLHFAILS